MKSKLYAMTAILLIAGLMLAACGGSAPAPAAPAAPADAAAAPADAAAAPAEAAAPAASGDAVTIEYWLWDANQQPAYQKCADDFMAANPNIKVNITQSGWNDYWNGIQTGMVSGTAPDVFTNHLAKYPEFAAKEQLVDIQPLVDADGVDLSVYIGDLADLWTRDGKRFGLPKDWDTVSIVYNTDALEAAGVTVDELNSATWNPEDGGTFGEIIAKLSIDENGNNGLSPDYDKTKVKQYGYVLAGDSGGGSYGQTEWSFLTSTTGWQYTDGMYATKYYYDDPRFTSSIQWIADMMAKGLIMPFEQSSSLGSSAIFQAGTVPMTSDGSWMIGAYAANSTVPFAFARLPEGPEGRKSMFNGLADSIWTGSKHQPEAWQWVKYAASQACADVVGTYGVVFPAQQSAVDNALKAFGDKGLDVSAFTTQALEEGGTFLFPVTDFASNIDSIMRPAIQSVLLGQADAVTSLTAANEEVNKLFQ